jgi:hypothetical protein
LWYPKASRSVLEVLSHSLEVLSHSLGVEVSLDTLDELDQKVQQRIEEFYQQMPLEIRGQMDRLKQVSYVQPTEPGPITEEEEKEILEDVENFFKRRGEGG